MVFAVTNLSLAGCGDECTTGYVSQSDIVVPPRPSAGDDSDPRDGGKDAPVHASVDAAGSADADADTENEAGVSLVDASVSTPAKPVSSSSDGGVLADWLGRPCAESCRLVYHSPYETTACAAPKKNADGQYELHCEYRYLSCKAPVLFPT